MNCKTGHNDLALASAQTAVATVSFSAYQG